LRCWSIFDTLLSGLKQANKIAGFRKQTIFTVSAQSIVAGTIRYEMLF